MAEAESQEVQRLRWMPGVEHRNTATVRGVLEALLSEEHPHYRDALDMLHGRDFSQVKPEAEKRVSLAFEVHVDAPYRRSKRSGDPGVSLWDLFRYGSQVKEVLVLSLRGRLLVNLLQQKVKQDANFGDRRFWEVVYEIWPGIEPVSFSSPVD